MGAHFWDFRVRKYWQVGMGKCNASFEDNLVHALLNQKDTAC